MPDQPKIKTVPLEVRVLVDGLEVFSSRVTMPIPPADAPPAVLEGFLRQGAMKVLPLVAPRDPRALAARLRERAGT